MSRSSASGQPEPAGRASRRSAGSRPSAGSRLCAGSRRGGFGSALHVAVASLALCCSPTAAPRVAEPLRLTHIRPSNPEGVFLNEEILFFFDQELDPASVTGGSIEILSESGRAARGDLRVETDHVRFVPAPVLASDLSDGGYLPDTRYRATLSGFPRIDGLRSARGALLQRTVTWDFRTVRVGHPRTGLLFEDRMQNRTGLLRLYPSAAGQGGLIRTQDSIYLACDKPIDPSTVTTDAFRLQRHEPRNPTPESVDVRVRLIENESEVRRRPRPPALRSSAPSETWEREPRACLVELTPVTRLAAGSWELIPVREAEGSEPRLRDFGGRPVLFAEASSMLRLTVDDPSAETGGRDFREEFQSRRYLSPVAVPGYDGTAYWSESGRVEVRYPAAAGSGADGDVLLGENEARSDVQGTSLDLPKDVECALSPDPGLVVLRCQGRMTIRGKLSREASPDERTGASVLEWAPPPREGKGSTESNAGTETLTAWIQKQRAAGTTWTVLIAGGDLEISGSLTSRTPLLLVAGGRIRVPGKVAGVRTGDSVPPVYLLREGGGFNIEPNPRPAPLMIDEPQGANPLKKSLRFAALSGPIPQRGSVLRWLPPESGGSPESKGGSWRIRFVPELRSAPTEATELHPVESPALLEPAGPVQFLVELEVASANDAGVWNPPWIDYVHLSWEQPQAEATPGGDDR